MSRKRRRSWTPPSLATWDSLYPTLDLHGETGESARVRAERWLRDHQQAGERTVRIVTGRGLHSVGPPVLPAEMGHLLSTLKGTVVARFETQSGGGSILVELRRPSPRRPSPAPAEPRARPEDARLWREAEESLAELGIGPTPALVRAEMERLRKLRSGAG